MNFSNSLNFMNLKARKTAINAAKKCLQKETRHGIRTYALAFHLICFVRSLVSLLFRHGLYSFFGMMSPFSSTCTPGGISLSGSLNLSFPSSSGLAISESSKADLHNPQIYLQTNVFSIRIASVYFVENVRPPK